MYSITEVVEYYSLSGLLSAPGSKQWRQSARQMFGNSVIYIKKVKLVKIEIYLKDFEDCINNKNTKHVNQNWIRSNKSRTFSYIIQ